MYAEQKGRIVVEKILDGSNAAEGGLQVGDVIRGTTGRSKVCFCNFELCILQAYANNKAFDEGHRHTAYYEHILQHVNHDTNIKIQVHADSRIVASSLCCHARWVTCLVTKLTAQEDTQIVCPQADTAHEHAGNKYSLLAKSNQ